jgi:NDP-sugar pyrophosphorylase family protein
MVISINLTVIIVAASVLLFFIAATIYLYVRRGGSENKLLKEMEVLKVNFSNESKLLRKKALDSELALDEMIKRYNNQIAALKNKLAEADKKIDQGSTIGKNSVTRENAAARENSVAMENSAARENTVARKNSVSRENPVAMENTLIVDFKDMVTEMIKRFHTVAELNNHLTNRHKAKAEKSDAIKSIVTDFQIGNRELEVLIEVLEQEVLSLDSKLKGQAVKSEMKG